MMKIDRAAEKIEMAVRERVDLATLWFRMPSVVALPIYGQPLLFGCSMNQILKSDSLRAGDIWGLTVGVVLPLVDAGLLTPFSAVDVLITYAHQSGTFERIARFGGPLAMVESIRIAGEEDIISGRLLGGWYCGWYSVPPRVGAK